MCTGREVTRRSTPDSQTVIGDCDWRCILLNSGRRQLRRYRKGSAGCGTHGRGSDSGRASGRALTLIRIRRTQKADFRVQRGFTYERGVSSGPWTASLTAMKSLTTGCVFEESMPMPINVCWRRVAKAALLVPVLRITSTMHSRIVVI
jgi:hypothetical protein